MWIEEVRLRSEVIMEKNASCDYKRILTDGVQEMTIILAKDFTDEKMTTLWSWLVRNNRC